MRFLLEDCCMAFLTAFFEGLFDSRVITEGWSPWAWLVVGRGLLQKLLKLPARRFMLEGVATLELLEAHREIVSLSSATEGMLLDPLLC